MPRRIQPKQRRDGDNGMPPSSSKKGKPSNPAPDVEVIELDPPGFNEDLLRCPICSQFPRKEVYQCNIGHSVCANCLTKLRKCPTCQGLFQKVRNYLAEGLLDSMKFQCSWKEFGCAVAPVARNDLTSHEAQCDFNPNSVKVCLMLFDKVCNKRFCPISTQDPAEMNVFLDHVKTVHGFAVRDVNHRESFLIHLKNNWFAHVIYPGNPAVMRSPQGQLFKTVFRLHSPQANQNQGRSQLFMILCHFTQVKGETAFLVKCVRLIDEKPGKMSISFSLKAVQGKKDGPGPQLPELCWTAKPEGLRELKDTSENNCHPLLVKPAEDLSSYYMISDAFLKNYISEGGITIKCIVS